MDDLFSPLDVPEVSGNLSVEIEVPEVSENLLDEYRDILSPPSETEVKA